VHALLAGFVQDSLINDQNHNHNADKIIARTLFFSKNQKRLAKILSMKKIWVKSQKCQNFIRGNKVESFYFLRVMKKLVIATPANAPLANKPTISTDLTPSEN